MQPSSTITRTQRQKRPRSERRNTLLAAASAFFLLSSTTTPANAFQSIQVLHQQPSVAQQPTTTTTLYFRNDDTIVLPPPPTDSLLSATATSRLPVWLTLPKSHLADTNLSKLQTSLRQSLFSEPEALQLLSAIQESSKGDRRKIAGAADFLQILVDTAELGLDALVAAAFHYVACLEAREQHKNATFMPRKNIATDYGGHAAEIAHDAGRLKRLEVLAATVLEDEGATRVRPDMQDAENMRKLLLSETKNWRALAIRSAACLYRLRGILHAQHRSFETMRTAREALSIYAPLASRLGMHRLKNELEGAAFRILYPRQFARVNELTHQQVAGQSNTIGASMKQVLDNVQEEMAQMLRDDMVFHDLVGDKQFSVTARFKEPYSLWKKMLRRGYKSILEVPDALALRIVLDSKKAEPTEDDEVTRARERALCYYAQNLCKQRWTPAADPRTKDYIENPKANGYQSLHYTAHTEWRGQDFAFEIQVRSGTMHAVAEFGLAAHFDYKTETSKKVADVVTIQDDDLELSYLRNVQEWHWKQHGGTRHMSPLSSTTSALEWESRTDRIRERTQRLRPYIEALKTAQWDLARDYVFVFLSDENSQVLALPAGACVLDALREVNRRVPSFNMQLNGSATSMTQQLHNGDVLAL